LGQIVVETRFIASVETQFIASQIDQSAHKFWHQIPEHFPMFVKMDEFVVAPNHVHGIIVINKSSGNGCDGRRDKSRLNGKKSFNDNNWQLSSTVRNIGQFKFSLTTTFGYRSDLKPISQP